MTEIFVTKSIDSQLLILSENCTINMALTKEKSRELLEKLKTELLSTILTAQKNN